MTLWLGEDYRTVADPRSAARKATDRALSEKEWQEVVIGEMRRLGYTCIYHHRPCLMHRRNQPPRWITNTIREGVGFPDLLAVRDGHMVVAELKQESKAPAEEQTVWLATLGGLPGCIAVYARPRDREVLFDILATPWKYTDERSTDGTGSVQTGPGPR